jgi:uncharacterized protein
LSEGRGLGIVCLLASQRPQKVHNDTLTSCETLMAMRVIHAADRGAVEDWIKGCGDKEQGKIVLNSLAGMARGEAFVWSPEIDFGPKRLAFPLFRTFDSFAPPQLQKRINEKGWADVDLTAVKEKLAAVIEKAKADDPKELRKRISELEKALKQVQGNKPETKVERVEVPAISKVIHADIKKAVGEMQKCAKIMREKNERAGEYLAFTNGRIDDLLRALERITNPPVGHPTALAPRTVHSRPPSGGIAQPRSSAPGVSNEADPMNISRPQQRILDMLAMFQVLGLNQMHKSAVAGGAGASPTSSSYTNNLGFLRGLGLIGYPKSDYVALTPPGLAVAQPPMNVDPTDLIRAWMQIMTGPQRRILQVLIDIRPDDIDRDELAVRAGASPMSSSYTNNLGRMRTVGAIDYPSTGRVVASEIIFHGDA